MKTISLAVLALLLGSAIASPSEIVTRNPTKSLAQKFTEIGVDYSEFWETDYPS